MRPQDEILAETPTIHYTLVEVLCDIRDLLAKGDIKTHV